MAMAGEWTVTSTRVVQEGDTSDKAEEKEDGSAEGRATGMKRERERTEEEKEQEEAIKGLFKKPRRWGIDSKTMPAAEDAELEALLSGPLVKAKKEDAEGIKAEKEESEPSRIKTEESQQDIPNKVDVPVKDEHSPPIKREPGVEDTIPESILDSGSVSTIPSGESTTEVPMVAFKKRKPKNIRQK
jgi:hypothetical protein